MTELDVAELRRLMDAATPGPWYSHYPDDEMCMSACAVTTTPIEPNVDTDDRANDHASIVALTLLQAPRVACHEAGRWDADAAFIAAARNSLPQLLDTLDALTARAEQAEAQITRLHQLLANLAIGIGAADGFGYRAKHGLAVVQELFETVDAEILRQTEAREPQ